MDHCNSASNKSAGITSTMSKMTRWVFDHRSNVSLITHLKTVQDCAAGLEDCGNKPDEIHFESLQCSSVRHSAFENMTDGFLSSAVAPPAVTTESTHKADRMSGEVPSKCNVNFQKSNKNEKDKKGNDKDDSKKKSKWWAEPTVWRALLQNCWQVPGHCLLLTDTTLISACQTSLTSPHNARGTGFSMSLQPDKGVRGNKHSLKALKLSPWPIPN